MLDEDTKKAWYEAGLIFGQGIANVQEKVASEDNELDPTKITMDEVFAALEEAEKEEKTASEEELDWSKVTLAEFIEAAQEVEKEDMEKEASLPAKEFINRAAKVTKNYGKPKPNRVKQFIIDAINKFHQARANKAYMSGSDPYTVSKLDNLSDAAKKHKVILALLGGAGVAGTGGYHAGKYKAER